MGHKGSRTRVHNGLLDKPASENSGRFEIVWFDERPKESLLKNQVYSEQVRSLAQYDIRFFQKTVVCEEYLRPLSTNTRLILLLPERCEEKFINTVQDYCFVKFIFMIHPEETTSPSPTVPTSSYPKIKHVRLNKLADRIRLIIARFLRSNTEFFSGDIFKVDRTLQRSSTQIDGRFLFTQLLLDVLLRMERKQNDKDELIVQCTEKYANDPSIMKEVRKFHSEYKPEAVFKWYTRDSFVYRQLNEAFRTENIDLIFLYRFFLQDLQDQLTRYQIQSTVLVYRYQLLSRKEWDSLSNATGQYVSMNSLLSTSRRKEVVDMYFDGNNPNSDHICVLLQIEADPHLAGSIKPFADISSYSQFPEEEEVLFMAGSIFRIIKITAEGSWPTMELRLCSDEDNHLKSLFGFLRREYGGEQAGYDNEASLNTFGIVLYNADRYDMASRFFRRIFYETSIDDPNRARYCMNIGNAAAYGGRYSESARWYDQAYKLFRTNALVENPLMGNLHLARGNLYIATNKQEQALRSFNEALTIFRNRFGDEHPSLALCYNSMAGYFERRKHYQTSLEYREKALGIAERTLPTVHPELVRYHLRLAELLINLRDQDLVRALLHARAALDIALAVYPVEHSIVTSAYRLLCKINALLGNFSEAIFWSNQLESVTNLRTTKNRTARSRRIDFFCRRCHHHMWIYRCFEWMKDTRFNCFVFHRIPFCFLELKRRFCHYWEASMASSSIREQLFYPVHPISSFL